MPAFFVLYSRERKYKCVCMYVSMKFHIRGNELRWDEFLNRFPLFLVTFNLFLFVLFHFKMMTMMRLIDCWWWFVSELSIHHTRIRTTMGQMMWGSVNEWFDDFFKIKVNFGFSLFIDFWVCVCVDVDVFFYVINCQ